VNEKNDLLEPLDNFQDADLFADEIDVRYNASLVTMAEAVSSASTASTAGGCICCLCCFCSADDSPSETAR
jgi:hypothetical protein